MQPNIDEEVSAMLSQGKIYECLAFLEQHLENALHPDANHLMRFIIKINTLFPTYSNNHLYTIYLNNKRRLTEHDFLKIMIWSTPIKTEDVYAEYIANKGTQLLTKTPQELADGHLSSFYVNFTPLKLTQEQVAKHQLMNIPISAIDSTIISFTIPYIFDFIVGDEKQNSAIATVSDGTNVNSFKIKFTRVSDFNNHPVVINKNHLNILISGNTSAHLFDIYPGQEEVTYIEIILPYAYHPEFTFHNDNGEIKIKNTDLSNEKAEHGEDYYPTKATAVKILRHFLVEGKINFNGLINDISVDSFSYFTTLFMNSSLDLGIIQRHYYLTSNKLHKKYTRNYISHIEKYGVFDRAFIEIYNNFTFDKSEHLKNFVNLLFQEVVANKIIYKSGYKYLWRDTECFNSPKSEPEIQPYLFNIIESLCQIKGVTVVRETETAEGELDMLFTCTSQEGEIFKVCVEVKLAHHSRVGDAIKSQLKRYLDSEQTKLGIYLVLWFKYNENSKFNKPTKYKSIDALKTEIRHNSPVGYNIDTLIIDCTKPTNPSRLH